MSPEQFVDSKDDIDWGQLTPPPTTKSRAQNSGSIERLEQIGANYLPKQIKTIWSFFFPQKDRGQHTLFSPNTRLPDWEAAYLVEKVFLEIPISTISCGVLLTVFLNV